MKKSTEELGSEMGENNVSLKCPPPAHALLFYMKPELYFCEWVNHVLHSAAFISVSSSACLQNNNPSPA